MSLVNFGGTAGVTNAGQTATNYNWAEAGRGLFSDALGAWVNVESIKAQAAAGGDAQAATRDAVTTPAGAPTNYSDTGRAGGGGINSQTLVIGGVLLVAALLVFK